MSKHEPSNAPLYTDGSLKKLPTKSTSMKGSMVSITIKVSWV